MIDYDLYKDIKSYANDHYKSSKEFYEKRKQDPSKIFNHIINGKVAEWCAYYKLIDQGYILDPPDMKIHSVDNKSHEADLIVTGKDNVLYTEKIHLHVKGVGKKLFAKQGATFLIQKNDSLVKHPKANHYFCVLIEHDEYTYSVYEWLQSTEAIFEKPLMDLPTHYAVYLRPNKH